jgi:hypothetical protein
MNNPYPQSGFQPSSRSHNGHLSFSEPASTFNTSSISIDDDASYDANSMQRRAPTISNKSTAPTVATNPETVNSNFSQSKLGTTRSGGGGANSTFSSPNHSERSLTTTLTTIQSTAPSNLLGGQGNTGQPATTTPVQFSHQFPVSPASALPPHLAPNSHPHNYHAATANGILTDNASIVTLASSSKRRRRHSLDTDASVRALAPSSVWGGSRESLPLSILSDKVDLGTSGGAQQNRPNLGGYASAERASVYSSSGVAGGAPPSGDRSSYYASKQIENASVKSGRLGHGRSESITGSIGGMATSSPLVSPRETTGVSRRSADWKSLPPEEDDEDVSDAEERMEEHVHLGSSLPADLKGKDTEDTVGQR